MSTPVSAFYDVPGPQARRRSRIVGIAGTIVLASLIAYMILVLQGQGIFDADRWRIFNYTDIWISLAQGLGATLSAAAIAATAAFALSIIIALARLEAPPSVRLPLGITLALLRGVPVVLMMFFVLLVFKTNAFFAVVAGLTFYNAAVMGEILRSGIQALPVGQREAGLSLGLSPVRTRLLIELPQAITQMLPSLIAQTVVLLKDTSMGYIVGYTELLRTIQLSSVLDNKYLFSVFFVGAAIYCAVNFTLSRLAIWIQRQGDSFPKTAGVTEPVPGVSELITK